ncbi:hypothetical protein BDZ94DRAFT_1233148 [Collybia nuda]|uniref:Uncharacterized protein n=1 Tax=Collybia nuda TaxID=64659 RepID=A0A9P5YGD6_9AGAR|nr:hypothetical protein BDZ94DRAFT_1233148 [Collybia nuda]
MSIPDSSFQGNNGSFTVSALPIPKNTQLYFAMSDATGAVSGGTSSLMTVGASLTGHSCNTTVPVNAFFFSADGILTQCGDFPFTHYQGAIKPLTIFAFIPNGSDSFVLPFSPPNSDQFNWKANISAQTQVTFSVIDSQGRNGGTDALRLVAPSNDKSCLLNTSSSSTSQSGNPTSGSDHKGGLPTGAVVGIAIGGAIVVVILILLLWWLKKRPNPAKSRRGSINLVDDFPQGSDLPQPMVGHQYAPIPYPSITASQRMSNPASPSQSEQEPQRLIPLRLHSQHFDEGSPSSASSSASGNRQTKFVVHRDIDEDETPIELPPQYDDRRAPIPGLNTTFHPPQAGQSEKRR